MSLGARIGRRRWDRLVPAVTLVFQALGVKQCRALQAQLERIFARSRPTWSDRQL